MPFKDSAMDWSADALTPITAALAAAPLAVVRVNHEDCNRGGNGYFIYMDPREGTEKTCAPHAPSVVWGVPQRGFSLIPYSL